MKEYRKLVSNGDIDVTSLDKFAEDGWEVVSVSWRGISIDAVLVAREKVWNSPMRYNGDSGEPVPG